MPGRRFFLPGLHHRLCQGRCCGLWLRRSKRSVDTSRLIYLLPTTLMKFLFCSGLIAASKQVAKTTTERLVKFLSTEPLKRRPGTLAEVSMMLASDSGLPVSGLGGEVPHRCPPGAWASLARVQDCARLEFRGRGRKSVNLTSPALLGYVGGRRSCQPTQFIEHFLPGFRVLLGCKCFLLVSVKGENVLA
jgi:hypothetical protein